MRPDRAGERSATRGYACPAGLCRNAVEDPLVPCDECTAAFGSYLRSAGREAADGELDALRARSEAKAAAPPAPVSRLPQRSRLNRDDLAEEIAHLAPYGLSREEMAQRLGVSAGVLRAALERSGRAA
jgi:hypothetical protein